MGQKTHFIADYLRLTLDMTVLCQGGHQSPHGMNATNPLFYAARISPLKVINCFIIF
jgi:hypothetical protein